MAWETTRWPDPGLAVGGVQEHVWERLPASDQVPEHGDFGVQISADPRHLGPGDPAVRPQRLDQDIDLASAGAVQVGLHDDREQRLVNPPPPLQ